MSAQSRTAFTATSLALFVALTVVQTWPLATNPGGLSRNDTHDTVHHEWILAWDAHALATDPLHLFDTNTFHPERDTLAYSDHIIVQGIIGAPFFWAGASPVLVYNLVLMIGLALTGWTTSLVVREWTGSRSAGVLSGSLMAFNAMTLTRFAEIQDQYLAFFPLTLLALDRVLSSPRARHALQLAAWFVLQSLTCGYLLAFVSLSLVAAVLVRPAEWIGARFRRVAPLLLLAGVASVVVLLPFLLPYLRVSQGQGFARSMPEVAMYSAHLTDYLGTGGRMHYSLWSHRFFDREGLFPGVVGAGLTMVALVSGVAWRDRRARMAVGFGVVAFALSFGPGFPLYETVTRLFPIMAGIRGASRFGQLFLAAVAILAGFGLARLQASAPRRALALAFVVIVGAHAEALRAPINYRTFDGVSPIFDSLRGTGRQTLVACYPFPPPREAFHNVDCMLASTRFWHPLLNGYSSFMPDSYARSAAALDAFPEGETLAYLRGLGVTHVIVFTDKVSAPRLARIEAHPGELVPWKGDRSARIYLLK
ncbi:MAG TPA: hypothetical protein VM032_16880 [Vicinamibacterales bacterium]|nr:hypothetical protein [Vicinamibacterales bacterium]